jgi:hypothetical protein
MSDEETGGGVRHRRANRHDDRGKGATVAVAVLFEFPNEPIDKYERVLEAGGAAVLEQPNRIFHVCYRTAEGFAVVDVWKDQESFEEFGKIIGPAIEQAGLHGAPTVYAVEGTIGQDGRRAK